MASKRTINFAAGPSKVPEEVMIEAQRDLINYNNLGVSVMELSHRSADFEGIIKTAEHNLRQILSIPDNYKVLFMHGGGTGQFAAIPMNLCSSESGNCSADYMVTGQWSMKAAKEAEKYCKVNRVFPKVDKYHSIPDKSTWKVDPNACYLYYCDNETVHGVEFTEPPESGDVPLVCDMSSNFLTRPVDVSKYGCIIAGTQKNCGIAGLVIIIVRDDLIGKARTTCPSIFDYKQMADNKSLLNTPPCFSIYMAGLGFKWLIKRGGLKEMSAHNSEKAAMLYDVLDNSGDFYHSPVDKNCRSRINVPFRVGGKEGNDALEKKFLKETAEAGMVQLKGHRSVGGIRASMFNAISVEEVQILINFMTEFMKNNR